ASSLAMGAFGSRGVRDQNGNVVEPTTFGSRFSGVWQDTKRQTGMAMADSILGLGNTVNAQSFIARSMFPEFGYRESRELSGLTGQARTDWISQRSGFMNNLQGTLASGLYAGSTQAVVG